MLTNNRKIILLGAAVLLLGLYFATNNFNFVKDPGNSNKSESIVDAAKNLDIENFSLEGTIQEIKGNKIEFLTGKVVMKDDGGTFVEETKEVSIDDQTVIEFFDTTSKITSKASFSNLKIGSRVIITTGEYPYDQAKFKARRIEIQI